MKVKGLLIGSALLALLGGCATYDDGYAYRNYGDGRYYSYRDYRNDGYYRRWDDDRYSRRYGPDFSWGFSYYNQH
jgi:hypothetical protein